MHIPGYTHDIDILVRSTSANATRVIEAIKAFGFQSLGLTQADFLKPDSIVQLGHPPNRLDLITSISGVETETAWARRVQGTLDGLPVHFIDRESLIANKRAAGRPKDLADAAALE